MAQGGEMLSGNPALRLAKTRTYQSIRGRVEMWGKIPTN